MKNSFLISRQALESLNLEYRLRFGIFIVLLNRATLKPYPMKTSIKLLFLLPFLFVSCEDDEDCCTVVLPKKEQAAYTVTFSFNWNEKDFPTDYPAGPHFSPLVGWTHQKDNPFFNAGKTATDGIELMAEVGATSTLVAELDAQINEGKGYKTYTGNELIGGVGNITIDVEVTTDFPAVSLATMLAPSPDWYVACVAVNLLGADNSFVKEKTIVGHVYDAGTDNGDTYSPNNVNDDTNPKAAIAKITQPPLGDGNGVKASLCSITFTKK